MNFSFFRFGNIWLMISGLLAYPGICREVLFFLSLSAENICRILIVETLVMRSIWLVVCLMIWILLKLMMLSTR